MVVSLWALLLSACCCAHARLSPVNVGAQPLGTKRAHGSRSFFVRRTAQARVVELGYAAEAVRGGVVYTRVRTNSLDRRKLVFENRPWLSVARLAPRQSFSLFRACVSADPRACVDQVLRPLSLQTLRERASHVRLHASFSSSWSS